MCWSKKRTEDYTTWMTVSTTVGIGGKDMRTKTVKVLLIIITVFLSGCGREENRNQNGTEAFVSAESRSEVSSEIEKGELVSAETERREDIWEEAEAQYPLIAAPAFAKWIELVLVSEETYYIFDGEKYGYMKEDGEEITPCIFDIAYPFSEGLACVYKEGRYGYIDLEGETAIPFEYDRAAPFMEGLAYFAAGDTYGFMDKTGEPVFYFECDSVSSFQEGLAYFSKDGRYGYIDQKGQIVIEPVFDDAGYFKDGLAKVMKAGRYGVIDCNGTLVVAAEYDSISINDGYIITESNGKYSCFDRMGRILLKEDDIDSIFYMAEKYIVFEKEGKKGLIDERGNILIEPLYDGITTLIPEQNFALVSDDGLYGIVDLQGHIKIPFIYDLIYYDSYEGDAEGGMFILRDADGNRESLDSADLSERIPCSYDSIDWIDEDRAIVTSNGFYGMIDREGETIEPMIYDLIWVFADDGTIWMKKGRKSWLYNSKGEAVEVKSHFDTISLKGNFYQIERDGKYGFLNKQGEEVVAPVYDMVSDHKVLGSDQVYTLLQYDGDGYDSIIKVGESEKTDIAEVLLQNEITPRAGLYQEFIRTGRIDADDAVGSDTAGQENLKEYRTIYKLYDLDHTGELTLFFHATPYEKNIFPMSYSGFYGIWNDQLVELVTGYECGGSLRGDYACLWYDRETSRVLPGTYGVWGGFGGYAFEGAAYNKEDGEMKNTVSFGYITQPISFYSEEELEHAELIYDNEDKPYTKEKIAQAENERVQKYSVNGVQTTIEEYQKMMERYQILSYVE